MGGESYFAIALVLHCYVLHCDWPKKSRTTSFDLLARVFPCLPPAPYICFVFWDWLIGLSASAVIGQGNYFGFGLRHSVKTALKDILTLMEPKSNCSVLFKITLPGKQDYKCLRLDRVEMDCNLKNQANFCKFFPCVFNRLQLMVRFFKRSLRKPRSKPISI